MAENIQDNTIDAMDETHEALAGVAAGLRTVISEFMERYGVDDARELPGDLGEFVSRGSSLTAESIELIYSDYEDD